MPARSPAARSRADAFADSGRLSSGDAAILRFLAAAELLETDLWQQYAELGGVNGGNPAYIAALENLDGDMPQYISDNTDDEASHAAFLNAYLRSKGAEPVNLDEFRTLPSSKATGARQVGRLTNLREPERRHELVHALPQPQESRLRRHLPSGCEYHNEPAIPLTDADTPPGMSQPVPPTTARQRRMQAIANTAGFHFAMIEQGGSSLYTTMSLKVTSLEVLRIVVSIGGVEVNHFAVWHDKAGNAVAQPLAGVTDPETGVTFPDLNARPSVVSSSDQSDHAGADRLHPQEPAEVLGHPAVHGEELGSDGRGRGADRERSVQGPVTEVLPRGEGPRASGRQCAPGDALRP